MPKRAYWPRPYRLRRRPRESGASTLSVQSHAAILAALKQTERLSRVFVPDRVSFKHHLTGAYMNHTDVLAGWVGQAFDRDRNG